MRGMLGNPENQEKRERELMHFECLKLAINSGLSGKKAVEAAKIYLEYIESK